MYEGLTRIGYQCVKPQGAFYVFPRTPIDDDVAFVRLLAEEGVLTVPGSGLRHARPHPHLAHGGARHRGARAARIRARVSQSPLREKHHNFPDRPGGITCQPTKW